MDAGKPLGQWVIGVALVASLMVGALVGGGPGALQPRRSQPSVPPVTPVGLASATPPPPTFTPPPPTPSPTFTPSPPTVRLQGSIATDTPLNVRAAPAPNAAVLTALAPTTPVTVLGRSADGAWVQLLLPSGTEMGWAAASFVALNGDVNTLPVTSGP